MNDDAVKNGEEKHTAHAHHLVELGTQQEKAIRPRKIHSSPTHLAEQRSSKVPTWSPTQPPMATLPNHPLHLPQKLPHPPHLDTI
jgi:hypothetical protein